MHKIILSCLAILMSLTVMSQKGDVIQGKWKTLSGIERFDLEFDYSDVQIPDFEKEEDYIKQKMKEKNEDEPGQGEIWRKKYFADRADHFEPKFIESFNKRGEQKVGKDLDESQYTLKVITTRCYNGWNVGVMRKPARIDAIIEIYNRDAESPVFVVKYEDVRGADALGYDFESHVRLGEAYAKLAKSFMKDFRKKA